MAPEEAPFDGCWWHPALAMAQLTPGTAWQVENGRFYAADRVGWHNTYVNFYRGDPGSPAVDVTPCLALVPQELQMMCKRLPNNDDYWVPYHQQTLVWGNNERCAGPQSPYVSSARGAACSDKSW